MGRELKRIPLDFDWPLNKIWRGYLFSTCLDDDDCDACRKFTKLKGIPLTTYDCPDFEPFKGPPPGDGFQLWETTSEGSPTSPVFATLDDLCEWCTDNATTFANFTATKDEWRKMFDRGFVAHEEGNVIFM